MTHIVRGRDIGGAHNDTRFGEHRRPAGDVELSASAEDPQFAGPLKNMNLQLMSRSVSFVTDEYMRDKIDLDAPYQRGSVWSEQQRRDLIRSALLGLPFGAVTINERGPKATGAYYACVDGRQRIEAFRAFLDDDLVIPATWLNSDDVVTTEDVPGWPVPGVRHSGTSQPFQRGFRMTPFAVSEAHVRSVSEEAEIFRLLNSGGVAQTEETMANALAVEQGHAE
ncbi:DUF262 domain-containing protein [Curtobacterium sp. MCBD17_040]|uniref:DUF262 domain-containing protein n=1 Tax=Curtobacterium sp. MCBD17_040 TaxID=2175674 RepID=UPI000DA9B81C|nr:DUF262 domain-containing protein [Curtobacterium sp. MCBD17_040]WIB65381.1 DUF262 domain-containing protein [Curtobacterium sp. MCBD17_040]